MAKKKLTRRIFIGTTAAGFAGAAVSIGGSNALSCKSRVDPEKKESDTGMKYRRLGRTNLMISEIILVVLLPVMAVALAKLYVPVVWL